MITPSIELTTGVLSPVLIPQLGFGTWRVGAEDAQRVTEEALAAGYRHIDTAAGYYNEAAIGAALRASGLPREEVFVTTKLRNGDQGYDSALRAFEDSRRALGLEVIDLYLVHWPAPAQDRYVETWRAFETLLHDGAARAIGVCNFLPEHLERLIAETDELPAVNQIEVHPTFQQVGVQEAAAAHGIAVEAYGPLGTGEDLTVAAIVAIAERLGVTPSQVILRWHLDAGRIALPKSVHPERMRLNLDVLSFELSPEDLAILDNLDDPAARLYPDPATAEFSQFRS